MNSDRQPGTPSEFVCPDCGGVLWEREMSNLLHFRCRTGHAYSEKSLLERQSESLEEAMWAAYRALQEKASLYRRMVKREVQYDRHRRRIERYEEQAKTAQQQAELIRQILMNGVSSDEEFLSSEET